MIILHSDKNTLVQQVQENLENILTLAGKIKDVYYTSSTLTTETASIEVSETDIVESEYTGGWLLDAEANLFNIVTISNSTAYIKYYASVKGFQGDQGDPCTVKVGTTTTLDAGSSATVTNSGTDVNAVLNFGIPKGANGKNIYSASYAIDNPDTTSTTFLDYSKTNIPEEDYNEATLVGAFILDSNSEIYQIKSFADLGEGSYLIEVAFFESIKGADGSDGSDGKDGKDGTGINSITDVKFNTIEKVTYADNTAVITGGFVFTDEDGNTINTSGTITLPIEAGDGITIDANESDDGIVVSAEGGSGGTQLYNHSVMFTLTDSVTENELEFYFNYLSSVSEKQFYGKVTTAVAFIELLNEVLGIDAEYVTSLGDTIIFPMSTDIDGAVRSIYRVQSGSTGEPTYLFQRVTITVSSGVATRITASISGILSDFEDDSLDIFCEYVRKIT